MGRREGWVDENANVVPKKRLTYLQRKPDGDVAPGFSITVPVADEFEVAVRCETTVGRDTTIIAAFSS